MRKRAAETTSPASTPKKGSPKKMKSPPKKAKEDQFLKCGQPSCIKCHRVAEFKLWQICNGDDKSDAFLKNITDEIRNDPNGESRKNCDFKGDVTCRVSLTQDEASKNFRKLFDRNFLVQTCEEDSHEKDLVTTKSLAQGEVQRVPFFDHCVNSHIVLSQCLCLDNPYNVEFIIDPANLDANNGETAKMDTLVIDSDVVRLLKMIYDIKSRWGDEHFETVEEFFHPENLTFSVRSALGMKLE